MKKEEVLRPSDVDFIPPLLGALAILMRLRGKPCSPRTLLSELAGSSVTPRSCLRAARRNGLSGKIAARKRIVEIPTQLLPCILLLTNGRCCVLSAFDGKVAEVIFPEAEEAPQVLPVEELQKDYTGYVLFAAVPTAPERKIDVPSLGRSKRWFWDVIRHYAPLYRHVAIASIVINLIAVASPLFVMNVYDRVIPNNAMDTLWVLASGIAVIYLFNFMLSSLRTHFVDTAGRSADIVLSSVLLRKVLSMRLDAKPESTGAMVNNLREFEQLREFFSSSSILACIDLPFLVIFLLLITFIAGPMVFLPVAAIPVLIFIGLFLQLRSRRAAEKNYRQNMQKNALLVEIVNGLETLKSCMAESRMLRLWEAVSGLSAKSASQSRRYNALAVAASVFVTQLVTVGMVIWGVYRIAEGEMTMGALIGVNILAGRVMSPLLQMASLLSRLQNSRITLKALDTIMQLPSENQDESTCMDFGTLEPVIEVENATFFYPEKTVPALENISLRIEPGERVGIIGTMGSGKSSLARLILGLYQPTEGLVRFGGVDIRQMPTADLRSRMGVMPQDIVLFYGTVRENIVLGDPTINDHMVLRAATLAGVSDFIKGTAAGFATQVGEQGKALSGGQRQAIALARAIVRDPDVIVLDEPTSNMDTDSERNVQTRLMNIIGDRTLILITHRLSMLRIVDRLIVLEGGKIRYDGPRDAVLAKLKIKSARK